MIRWLPEGRAGRSTVFVALAAGVALRVVGLDAVPLWLDEHGTAWVVAAGWGEAWSRALTVQGQSPFYYLLARAAVELGAGSLALRLPSLLCGLATLLLVYPLARAVLRDEGAATAAVVVAALWEPLILASQEARPYGLALALTFASFALYGELLERDGLGCRLLKLLWAATTAGAFYAHYLFGVVAAIQVVDLAVTRGPRRLLERRWRMPGLALAALASPGLAAFAVLGGRRSQIDWLAELPWPMQVGGVVSLVQPTLLATVAVAVLLLGGPFADLPVRRSLLAVGLLLPPALAVAARVALGVQLLFPRYLLAMVPAAILVVAWILTLPPAGSRRRAALAVYVVAAFAFTLLPPFFDVGAFSQRTHDGVTAASRAFRAKASAGEPVFYCSELVEADRIASTPQDADLASYLAWPLLSELEPTRRADVRALPHTPGPATAPYLASLVAGVTTAPRAWMIGTDRCLGDVGKPFFESGLELAGVDRFENVVVLELRRRPTSAARVGT